MNRIFQCHRCGVIARAERQLCEPWAAVSDGRTCPTDPERPEAFDDGNGVTRYVCRNCGQPALEAELICNPYMPE